MVIGNLDEYRKKRDPKSTPEPFGTGRHGFDEPMFVIHKHGASNLHYDFRLEGEGVLKSWAVPKGPSTDPSEKRLAVRTEDHPLEYLDFEATIPEGQYGAGPVLVWDMGPYENRTTDDDGDVVPLTDAVDNGHVVAWLHGSKLSGGYALTRVGRGKERWLLVKMHDEGADARRRPTSTQPESVKTGQDLEDIAEEGP